MKRYIIIGLALLGIVATAAAQDNSGAVRRRDADRGAQQQQGVTERMQMHFEKNPTSDADLQWMRVIYRQLDLTKDANTPLYFPDEPVEGQDNLFRIIMGQLASGALPAYEYLDGREVFNDNYRIKVKDMLDRFHIIYSQAKGSTDKNPKFTIDESDVPANEVLSYYIIERWEFDSRSNRVRTVIDAICPVLHRSGDFGGEAVRYPMFWVKFDDLRPYLSSQNIFTSDANNLATCTYDDYFQLGLYDGDIYKTRNLRNQSLMQQYPDPDDLARAQDSIQTTLTSFGDKLWVKDPEQIAKARAEAKKAKSQAAADVAADDAADASVDAAPAVTASDEPKENTRTKRGKTPKAKKPKAPKSSGSSSNAARSVRNRKR